VAVSAADDEPGAVISGHYLWPAAEMLATYLLEQETRLRPVTVVELGAGCALASLAALQIWQDVLQCLVVTDHDPGTLERACDNHESTLQELLDSSLTDEALNSAINDLGSIPVFFQGLEWGKQDALLSIREILQEHTNTRKGCFDVVLGSDLIYCLQVVEPLFQTVADLMTLGQHSVFILTQSFAYEEETEGEIDRVCEELGLLRSLISDDGKGNRIQEFGRQQQHQLQEQQAVAKGNVADLQEPE
jgi:predicted nicotinamide N-methyase